MSESDDLLSKAASWIPGAGKDVTVGKDPAGEIVGNVASSAVTSGIKGAAIGTAVAEGVTWGSIGAAAALSAAGSGGAALGAIGAGAAIGNAIPIPGLGAAIGAIVGALVALANAFKGPDYAYVAKTPKDAKLLLELIRVSPTFLPHLMATLVLEGKAQDPGALVGSLQSFWDSSGIKDPGTVAVATELAQRMGGLKGDVSGREFDENALYILVKLLKLLAREGPGIKYKGPVVWPAAFGFGPKFVGPDADALNEFDGLPLKYLNMRGPWEYQKLAFNPAAGVQKALFGKELRPDPLLDPAYLRSLIEQWAQGKNTAPVIKSAGNAQRVLKALRERLAPDLIVAKDRSAAQHIDLRPLRNEIKAVRILAGEHGPDPVLEKVFGDVTVTTAEGASAVDWLIGGGVGVVLLGACYLTLKAMGQVKRPDADVSHLLEGYS